MWVIWLAVQSFRLFLPRACTTVTLGGLPGCSKDFAKHSLWRSVYSEHSRCLKNYWLNLLCKPAVTYPIQYFLLESHLQFDQGSKFQSFIFCWAGQPVFIPGSVTYQPHYLGQVAVCKWWVVADGFLTADRVHVLGHSLFNFWNKS